MFRGVLESGGCLKGAAPSRRQEVTAVVSLGTGWGAGGGGAKYVTKGDLVNHWLSVSLI